MEPPKVRDIMREALVEYVADNVFDRVSHDDREYIERIAIETLFENNIDFRADPLAALAAFVGTYIGSVSAAISVFIASGKKMRLPRVGAKEVSFFGKEYYRNHWKEILEGHSSPDHMFGDRTLVRRVVEAFLARFMREADWLKFEGASMQQDLFMRRLILHENLDGLAENPWEDPQGMLRELDRLMGGKKKKTSASRRKTKTRRRKR